MKKKRTPIEREFIMTGYTPNEWGELWGQKMLND